MQSNTFNSFNGFTFGPFHAHVSIANVFNIKTVEELSRLVLHYYGGDMSQVDVDGKKMLVFSHTIGEYEFCETGDRVTNEVSKLLSVVTSESMYNLLKQNLIASKNEFFILVGNKRLTELPIFPGNELMNEIFEIRSYPYITVSYGAHNNSDNRRFINFNKSLLESFLDKKLESREIYIGNAKCCAYLETLRCIVHQEKMYGPISWSGVSELINIMRCITV